MKGLSREARKWALQEQGRDDWTECAHVGGRGWDRKGRVSESAVRSWLTEPCTAPRSAWVASALFLGCPACPGCPQGTE